MALIANVWIYRVAIDLVFESIEIAIAIILAVTILIDAVAVSVEGTRVPARIAVVAVLPSRRAVVIGINHIACRYIRDFEVILHGCDRSDELADLHPGPFAVDLVRA